MTNEQEVRLGALQKLRKLEGAGLTYGIVRNVAVSFHKLFQRVLMFSSTIVNGVVMENEGCVVANSQLRKNADKAVSISRARHHDAILALEKFAEFGKFRGDTLVFAFDVFFDFLFLADNLCNGAEPFVRTLDTVRLRGVNLRNTEGFFKWKPGGFLRRMPYPEGNSRAAQAERAFRRNSPNPRGQRC